MSGDCAIALAADLQDPPQLITAMVEKWQKGAKFVVCVRTRRADPLTSRVFSYFYYLLVRFFVIEDYPKRGFDLTLMDRTMVPYIQNSGKHINVPLLEYWLGFKPAIIEYERQPRLHGRSRWSFARKLKDSFDSILGFSIRPLRFISLVGLIVSLLSFGYGLVVIITAAVGHREVPGFASIATLLSFLFVSRTRD